MSKRKAPSKLPQGFSLLELMITVAIVAILATIAFASYQDQVIKSRRAAGAACLQERAQFMERFYTTNLTYVGAPVPTCDAEVSQHYAVSYFVAPAAATPRAFVLQVVPQGNQGTRDTKCGTLRINQQGARTITGTGTEAECW